MRPLEDLAGRLVDYDRALARNVVGLIIEELGGSRTDGRLDLDRAHAFLSRSDVVSGMDEPKTTAEWKVEWTRRERLRSLGLVLVELLDQPG